MTNSLIEQEILAQLQKLDEAQQQQVLQFTRFLAMNKVAGVSGKALLRFAGTIPKEELELMSKAIQEGCEQINGNEW